MPERKGLFITLEGADGSGKSTQAQRIAEDYRERGHQVLVTHEPGGTRIGERIRDILLDPELEEMCPLTELFLFLASRAQHTSERIKPALDNGATVISSRYADATEVYQGIVRGVLPIDEVRRLNDIATEGLKPDKTLVFDVHPETGLPRAKQNSKARVPNGEGDRFEQAGEEFQHQVREGYMRLAKENPERIEVIEQGDLDETTNTAFGILHQMERED